MRGTQNSRYKINSPISIIIINPFRRWQFWLVFGCGHGDAKGLMLPFHEIQVWMVLFLCISPLNRLLQLHTLLLIIKSATLIARGSAPIIRGWFCAHVRELIWHQRCLLIGRKTTLILLKLWNPLINIIDHHLNILHELWTLARSSSFLFKLFWAISSISVQFLPVCWVLCHLRNKGILLRRQLIRRAVRKLSFILKIFFI